MRQVFGVLRLLAAAAIIVGQFAQSDRDGGIRRAGGVDDRLTPQTSPGGRRPDAVGR